MIGERIKKERTKLGLNQPDFAQIAGVSRRTVIDWEKNVSSPTAVQLSALSEIGIDVGYVVTGKSLITQPIEQEFSSIPVHDVEVSAGDGALNESNKTAYSLAFRNDWLKSRGLHVKDLHVVIARGDSMEPTIGDKDSLLVCTAEKNPKDGHIYVIRSGNMLWVKRIQVQLDGGLLLISDNKMYPPMLLNLDESSDIEVIGKVVNSSKNFY